MGDANCAWVALPSSLHTGAPAWLSASNNSIQLTASLLSLLFEGEGDQLVARRGDPLYGLDDYSQLGATAVFELGGGLAIETGAVGQLTDDELNYTYMVNFTWGRAFALSFLKPRPAAR